MRNEELGGFEWDMCKLDNWYYRRFLGDHKDLSTGEPWTTRPCDMFVSLCAEGARLVHKTFYPLQYNFLLVCETVVQVTNAYLILLVQSGAAPPT